MKKYKYFDLQTEMIKHNESQEQISRVLGITSASFRNKLDGLNEWTIGEIDKLCEHYNKNYYELFKKE